MDQAKEHQPTNGGRTARGIEVVEAQDNTVVRQGAQEDPSSPEAMAQQRRWQTLWPQIVAESWADPDFKKILLGGNTNLIRREVRGRWGYELPSTLELRFKEVADGTRWFWRDANGEYHMDCDKLGPNVLIMPLPPSPADDGLQAVAITAYAHAGRTYPFTCW